MQQITIRKATITDCAEISALISRNAKSLLNDDFEGGLNVFPKQKIEIEPQTARMVLYPASFAYPSEILPITSRAKYMVVGYFK